MIRLLILTILVIGCTREEILDPSAPAVQIYSQTFDAEGAPTLHTADSLWVKLSD